MLKHPAILERVINRDLADFSPEVARQILSLDFPAADHARYAELSARASDGTLTDEERSELEDYLDINDFLMIIKTKAEMSLRRRSPAA
jgi:hypothetical protein